MNPRLLQKLGLDECRVYLQGQNLFTLTGYSGLDPAITNVGDLQDIYTGFDFRNYPASKILMMGINVGF